jgi:hypothetical protein
LVLAGCRVDARVDISVRSDGSGTVRARVLLDKDAAARIGGTSALRLDDLRAAGWSVATGPRSVTIEHDFVGRAELSDRIADLAGNSGVLGDAEVERRRGRFAARDSLSVRVDLRHFGAGVGGDAKLREALASAGVDVDALSRRLDDELRDAFHLTVAVHLPDGTTRTVRPAIGSVSTVAATSRDFDALRVLAVGAGVAFGLVAVVLVALSVRRGSRR